MVETQYFDWTEERISQLTAMIEVEGLSDSQAARRLGTTDKTVNGKVYRLQLKRVRGSGRTKSEAVTTHRRARPSRRGPARIAREACAAVVILIPPRAPEPKLDPHGERYTTETISHQTCKWPLGDPGTEDFHFCGHAPRTNDPYCEFHAKLASTPSGPRKQSFTPAEMAKAFGG